MVHAHLLRGLFAAALLTAALPGTAEAADAIGFGTAPVASEELGAITGREDTYQSAFSNHTATVSRTEIGDGSITGDVSVTDSAFQNISGLSAVNINTGNNVALNSALNVNISITPAP